MPQKKQIKLETEINEIVIINNKKLTPYIELVNFSSRNIDQKKLGTILGIFEIKDTSEDSAYIVNFLSSVAKKTYFASHQKNPEESFESTLAKVNLSLSEVAKHGNINWIGKIDAVLCSVFENQINFSVSGDAKVLLLRNGKLTEISAGLSPKDEAANPLKTFTDIASGRLELDDKLILTTDDISHIFTLDDIEKYALSFKNDKFLRFLKTALVNELDIAGTIIIDTKKVPSKNKERETATKSTRDKASDDEFNLFGNKAFEETKKSQEKISVNEALIEEENKKEYVHKQTGHIYISDSNENYENFHEDKFGQFLDNLKEKFSDLSYWLKEKYLKKGSYKLKKKIISLFKKEPSPSQEVTTPEKSLIENTTHTNLKISARFKKLSSQLKNKTAKLTTKKSPTEILPPSETFSDLQQSSTYSTKISSLKFRKIPAKNIPAIFHQKIIPALKIFLNFIYRQFGKILNLVKKGLPHFKKLKKLFLAMSFKMKIVTILILLIILITPLIMALRKDDSTKKITNNDTLRFEESAKINPSTQSYKEALSLYEDSNLIGVFVFDNTVFAISKNKISSLGEKNKDYNFPENFKNAQYYSFMNDLNLLFLINDKNQIISFSPISLKFKEDTIAIKENSSIEGIGTYLTYLYIVDSSNKQIYRYPRADNGFGEKIDWLQNDINFDNITGLALDGNLYLAKKDTVLKLFNRKTQDFNLKVEENSSLDEIFTHEDISYIYTLDNLNGELIKFDKNGNKQSFLSNQNLTQARKIWADEKNALAYFTTETSLYKISLP